MLLRIGCYLGLVAIQAWLLFRIGCHSGLIAIQDWLPFRIGCILDRLITKIRRPLDSSRSKLPFMEGKVLSRLFDEWLFDDCRFDEWLFD